MSDRIFEADVKKYGKEKAEKIRELQAVIFSEMQKSEDEMNTDLIDECVDWCLELKGQAADITDDEIERMCDECISQVKANKKCSTCSVKRTIISILVAALMITVTCITAFGIWGPFDSFVENIRDLFNIKSGAVVETPGKDLTFDKGYECYDSIEDFYEDTKINILYPEGVELASENPILYYTDGNECKLMVFCSNGSTITTYFAGSPFNKETFILEDENNSFNVNGRQYFLLKHNNDVQLVMFENAVTYVIQTSNLDSTLVIINELKYIEE